MSAVSPCLSCGACCSSFRVSFYWQEAVPEGSFVETTPMYRSLKSMNDSSGRPRCNALSGEIGKGVACQIYENRPSPCRDFKYSYEEGVRDIRCDEARSKFGMKPLPDPSTLPSVAQTIL